MPDYTLEDTVYKRFTTRAFATGIPTVLSGSPVVSAYEDDSVTQITAGITLGVDHDSVVGLNLLTIVASAANGYEAGKSYDLVITTGTVDSVSVVGETVWHFTLSAEAAAVDLANGTDGLGAIKGDTAAILVDTSTTLQAELDAIQAAVITNASGVDIAADIIAVKADTAAVLVDTADMQPKLGTPAADVSADIAAVKVDTAAVLVDTSTTLQAELDAIQAAVITNASGADIAADIIAIKADTAAVLVDTADMQPKLGTPAADVSADIAAVKVDTAAVLVDTSTTLQAELDAIQAAVITNASGVDIAADIIAVKADTAAVLVDTADMQPKLGTPAADVSADIAAVKVDTAAILVDTGTTLQAELDAIQAATITNASGADIAADIIAVKAETALIVGDTNELQGDWVNGGRLDLILDAVLAMLDDARGEPGQGAPPVNADAMTKLDYLYKFTRNLKDNDGSTTQFYNDAGTTVDHKQTTSEAAGTVTKTEIISGP